MSADRAEDRGRDRQHARGAQGRLRVRLLRALDWWLPPSGADESPEQRHAARATVAVALAVAGVLVPYVLYDVLAARFGRALFDTALGLAFLSPALVLRRGWSQPRAARLFIGVYGVPLVALALFSGGNPVLILIGLAAAPVIAVLLDDRPALLMAVSFVGLVFVVGTLFGDRLPVWFEPAPVDGRAALLTAVLALLAPAGLVTYAMHCISDAFRADRLRQAEQAHLLSLRLAAVQRVSGVGGWELDLERRRVWWSPELYALLGVDASSQELPTEEYTASFVFEEDLPVVARFRKELRHGVGRVEHEVRIRRADGASRWIRFEGGSEPAASDGRRLFVGTAKDITEERALRTELAAHRDRLEQLVEKRTGELEASRRRLRGSERLASLGTLSAGMAHQVNNPIAAIMAGSQYALAVEGAPDERDVWRKTLAVCIEEARRCGQIVRSLLQFARDEPTEKWTGDLGEVLRRSVAAVSQYAARNGVTLELSLPSDPILVHMSPIELEQVFVNGLRNAVEAQPVSKRVEILAGVSAGLAQVHISDDGVGIDATHVDKLFDPFFSTRIGEGGTGLGLSVAHGIISDHGGHIHLQSQHGIGTRMTVELSVQKSAELSGADGARPGRGHAGSAPSSRQGSAPSGRQGSAPSEASDAGSVSSAAATARTTGGASWGG